MCIPSLYILIVQVGATAAATITTTTTGKD